MGRIEDYVEAVTRRLRPDAELRMDVARELRAHLEDAAAEARAQGRNEEQSVEAALEAFGDREELADQLWQANRGRMRLHAVAKWTTRLALLPAAMLLALILAGFTLRMVPRVVRAAGHRDRLWELAFDLGKAPQPRPDLSEEDRFLFQHLTEELTDAQTLIRKHPDDPVLYAHYVRLLSEHFHGADIAGDEEPRASHEEIEGWLEALDRGERIEPDNAFYDYLKAYLLMVASSSLEYDKGISFEYPSPDAEEGGTVQRRGCRLSILDDDMFERAMREVYEGMAKPHYTSYAGDVARLREGLWRRPRTLTEWLGRTLHHGATLMPHLWPQREVLRRLPSYAVLLAERGDTEGAADLASVMHRPAVQMGADTWWVIELLVAQWGFTETAGQAPEILKQLGRPAQAAEARQSFERTLGVWNRLRAAGKRRADENRARLLTEGSVIGSGLMSVNPTPEFWELNTPLRRVEHVFLDRLALGILTGVFALLTALLAVVSGWSAWRRAGADDGPKLFFIGWKRLAGVLLAGLAVPLGLYWAWTRVLPFGGLRLGLYHFWQRMAEIGLLYLLVMFATTSATYQAVRRRCIEAGMEVGPPGHLNPLRNVRSGLAAAALCVGVGVVAFGLALLRLGDAAGSAAAGCGALAAVVAFPPLFVLWQLRHQGWRWRSVRTALALFGRGVISLPVAVMGAVSMAVAAVMALHYVLAINGESLRAILLGAGGLLIVVLAYLLARVAQSAPSDAGIGHFRRTLRRSMVPVLAAGVLALGLLSHAHLSWAEARQIALLSRPGVQLHDLEMTGFKEYGDHLRELNRRWLAESPLRSDAPSLPLAPVEP